MKKTRIAGTVMQRDGNKYAYLFFFDKHHLTMSPLKIVTVHANLGSWHKQEQSEHFMQISLSNLNNE
jgi:hypothetical protein